MNAILPMGSLICYIVLTVTMQIHKRKIAENQPDPEETPMQKLAKKATMANFGIFVSGNFLWWISINFTFEFQFCGISFLFQFFMSSIINQMTPKEIMSDPLGNLFQLFCQVNNGCFSLRFILPLLAHKLWSIFVPVDLDGDYAFEETRAFCK